MDPKLTTFGVARTPRIVRLTALFLLAVAAGMTGCNDNDNPTSAKPPVAPDLRFEPSALAMTPGGTVETTVRVDPAADLRGATFTIADAPAGVTTTFEAAADGASGTLKLTASASIRPIAWSLTINGRRADGAKTWVGNLSITVFGSPHAFFVNPGTGDDANRGTQAKPFKTLTRALASARSGDTVNLAGGGYGPAAASGETFGTNGLAVPAGVTIIGALDAGGTQVSTLQGAAGNTGLAFQGDATVKNLNMIQFDLALRATQGGAQTLTNMLMGANKFNIGVGGSSRMTLVGSTIILLTGNIGVQTVEQAQFTMDSGTIRGFDANCIAAGGVRLSGASQATFKNGAQLVNIAAGALGLRETAKATFDRSSISNRELVDGCAPQPQVTMNESTSLTLKKSELLGNSTTVNAVGIEASSNTGVTIGLDSSTVHEFTGKCLSLVSLGGKLVMNGGFVESRSDGIAIDANKEMPLVITNAIVIGPGIKGVGIRAGNLKLRNSKVFSSGTAIKALNQGAIDLGTLSDPGNNILAGGNITGVAFDSKGFDTGTINAVGNTWEPNVQGADANGHYTTHRTISGGDANSSGVNFTMFLTGQKIIL